MLSVLRKCFRDRENGLDGRRTWPCIGEPFLELPMPPKFGPCLGRMAVGTTCGGLLAVCGRVS
jgi:hypothetical protein